MPWSQIVVPLLAAMAVVGNARAQPEPARPPVDVDPARLTERHVIEPGTEALLGDMLGSGQALPTGCTFTDGQIERTSVLATYTCGDAPVVLQLLHPDVAPRGAVRTQRFAIAVQSGTPPAGLVDAVAERVRAREAGFQWKTLELPGAPGAARRMLPWVVGGGAAVLSLAFWAIRRRRA